MYKIIAVVSLIVSLAAVNWSIRHKELHLSTGTTVYLQLAPVDPRSLMQGDYMALRFALANDIQRNLLTTSSPVASPLPIKTSDGYVVVTLDTRGVASYGRLDRYDALADNEIKMHYRVRGGRIKFATNAFFFQEGTARAYQNARYGQFKVDSDGELLLTGLYDKELLLLGQPGTQ